MNCLLGLIMNVIEKDISVRATYDVVLAIDNVAHPMGSLMFTMFTVFCLILSMAIIIYNGKYTVDNF